MYYNKQILPIDKQGGFLLAVHFARYKIGGECTRESRHAYFGVGNINSLDKIKDITHLCIVERSPSESDVSYNLNIAQAQKDLGRNEEAWMYSYHASLAEHNSQYVPRVVLTSLSGKLALGTNMEVNQFEQKGCLKYIDISTESIIAEHIGEEFPNHQIFAEPEAISSDGEKIVTFRSPNLNNTALNQSNIIDFKDPVEITGVEYRGAVRAVDFGWITADDNNIKLSRYNEDKAFKSIKTPRGIFPWTLVVSSNGKLGTLCGDKGLICMVDLNTGKVKKYYPHRGCKRDDFCAIAVSGDNDWMASMLVNRTELVVTDLKNGQSWAVSELSEDIIIEKEEGEYKSVSKIPAAFNFIESQLLVSDSNGIKTINYRIPADASKVIVSEQGLPGARFPLNVSASSSFNKMLKDAKLETHKERLEELYSPAVKIKTKKHKKSNWSQPGKRGAPELGVSRFGGWPDLPVECQWPQWQSKPMSFLAQLNFVELHKCQPNLCLPKAGVLFFFIGCSEETFENDHLNKETHMIDLMLGTKSEHQKSWKVIYANPDSELERKTIESGPLPELFSPCLLTMHKSPAAFPNEQTAAYELIKFGDEDKDNFNELLDVLAEEYPQNQIMGYPHLLQYMPPEISCELARNGKDPYKLPEENSAEYLSLLEKASCYGLLLQLTSDENTDFCWGDAGHLYFYSNREKMRSGDFSESWVVFEN